MARVVFYKVCTANSDVRFSACAVPHVSSEKKHGASHFVGVDKGNTFYVALYGLYQNGKRCLFVHPWLLAGTSTNPLSTRSVNKY